MMTVNAAKQHRKRLEVDSFKNIFRYYFIVLINVLVWYCC